MADSKLKILVVRLSSIGDIVHALPAVAALAQTFPHAQIEWLVEKRHALLLKDNPHLHRIVTVDTLGWRRNLTDFRTWRQMRASVRDLRRTVYDTAIDFQGLWKSAVAAWMSGARERIGYGGPCLREPPAEIFYTQQVTPREGAHVVEENLALVERLGARTESWQFALPHNDADDQYVERELASRNCEDFIIVNPGGGWRAKCWAPENYSALIRQLAAGRQEQIIVTGSPLEEPVIGKILKDAESPRAYHLPTTVVQFISLARRARLFIGGDTGPLHLAAAVGAPVVGIYGPTDPARNGPFAADDIALSNCGPINHTRRESSPAYLAGISVEAVVAAAEKRLKRVHG